MSARQGDKDRGVILSIAATGMFMALRLPPVLLVLTLSACASMSAVNRVGEDTYQVSYSAGLELMSWVEIKHAALQQANDYCTLIGQKMLHPKITSNSANNFTPKRAEVNFQCGP